MGVVEAVPPTAIVTALPSFCVRLVESSGVGERSVKFLPFEAYPFDVSTTSPVTAPEGTTVAIAAADQLVNVVADFALVNTTSSTPALNTVGQETPWQK